jgi:transcriptional regulator with XRE-family HTH domain
MEIKDTINRLLEAEKLSQIEFAKKVGVQRSNITHVLNGRSKPSYDFLLNIIRAFPNINIEWIMTGTGEMYKNKEPEPKKSEPKKPEIMLPEKIVSPTLFQDIPPANTTTSRGKTVAGKTGNAKAGVKPVENNAKPAENNAKPVENKIKPAESESRSEAAPDLPVVKQPSKERKIKKVIFVYSDRTTEDYDNLQTD